MYCNSKLHERHQKYASVPAISATLFLTRPSIDSSASEARSQLLTDSIHSLTACLISLLLARTTQLETSENIKSEFFHCRSGLYFRKCTVDAKSIIGPPGAKESEIAKRPPTPTAKVETPPAPHHPQNNPPTSPLKPPKKEGPHQGNDKGK